MMNVDLKAYRCPNAQILANTALQRFIASDEAAMSLTSIEPSLERSLKQRIALLDLPVVLVEDVVSVDITAEQRTLWLSDFDEEDFEDVALITTYSFRKL